MTRTGFRTAVHGQHAALSVVVIVALLTSACTSSTPSGSSPAASSSPALSPSQSVVSPSPVVSPQPAVSSSPKPSPSLQAVRITVAGTDVNGPLLQLTAQLPAGWTLEQFATYRGSSEPPAGMGLFFSLIDNTFKDPCLHVERSPKVGPTAADAAAALGEIPNTTATKPVQATIARHQVTYLELSIPASLPCATDQFYLWQDSPNGDWWVQGVNELVRVWILEAGGRRVVIANRSWPGTSEQAKAELQGILDSIVFDAGS